MATFLPEPSSVRLQRNQGWLCYGEAMRLLTAVVAVAGVAGRWPVFVLDAANRFDPYLVAREGRRLGLAPDQVLERIQVARAFTCHQLVQLVEESLPTALAGAAAALVIILGPCSLFYDAQVPLAERRRLFQTLVTRLAGLKPRLSLWLLQPPLPPFVANQHFGRLLARLADRVARVDPAPGGQGLGRGERGLQLPRSRGLFEPRDYQAATTAGETGEPRDTLPP